MTDSRPNTLLVPFLLARSITPDLFDVFELPGASLHNSIPELGPDNDFILDTFDFCCSTTCVSVYANASLIISQPT